jgi:hypothetical protein
MARSFSQVHKAEANPITTPGIYEYGPPGARRARTYSQVIAESTRGMEAGAAMTATPQGPNGPKVEDRQAPDWRGHYLGKRFATPVGKVESPGTLYVHRPLTNAEDLALWAKGAGIPNIVPPEEMHATQVYSRQAVTGLNVRGDTITVTGGARSLGPLGDKGAVVLHFVSQEMQDRHAEAVAAGASHDFPKFLTHITLSYDAGGADLSKITPPSFPLVFGPEVHAPINEDWAEEKGLRKVIKAEAVNDELGLVFGWAIVCKEDGAALLRPQYRLGGRIRRPARARTHHRGVHAEGRLRFRHDAGPARKRDARGPETGSFAFIWPLTSDIAKAMGITCKRTGLMVAYHPEPGGAGKIQVGRVYGFLDRGLSAATLRSMTDGEAHHARAAPEAHRGGRPPLPGRRHRHAIFKRAPMDGLYLAKAKDAPEPACRPRRLPGAPARRCRQGRRHLPARRQLPH